MADGKQRKAGKKPTIEQIEPYLADKYSFNDIAKKFGVDRNTIDRMVREAGLELKDRRGTRR